MEHYEFVCSLLQPPSPETKIIMTYGVDGNTVRCVYYAGAGKCNMILALTDTAIIRRHLGKR